MVDMGESAAYLSGHSNLAAVMTPKIKIRKADVLEAFSGVGAQVATLLGINRVSVYGWGEYVPELSARRLLELRPDLQDLVVDPATGLSLREMRRRLAAETAAGSEQQA